MSEYNIAVDSGVSVRLKTAGKYCDRDIVVTATAGGAGGDIDALIDGSITEIHSGKATFVRQSCFQSLATLRKAKFMNATGIGQNAFYGCTRLIQADFLSVTSVGSRAFYSCTNLKALLLRTENVASLGDTYALSQSGIGQGVGYIYVPSALLDSYKVSTNWKSFSKRFRALEDYTVDGTITGELDESKI